eukprot:85341_1
MSSGEAAVQCCHGCFGVVIFFFQSGFDNQLINRTVTGVGGRLPNALMWILKPGCPLCAHVTARDNTALIAQQPPDLTNNLNKIKSFHIKIFSYQNQSFLFFFRRVNARKSNPKLNTNHSHLSFLFFYKIYFIFSIISYCLNRAPYDPAESHAQTQITSFLSIHFFHYSARKRTQIQSQNNQKQTTISYNFLSLNKIKSFHIKINHFYSFFGV